MKFIIVLAFTIISIISIVGCFSNVCNEEVYSLKAILIITYGIAGPIWTIEYVIKAWKKLLSKE